MRCETRRNEAKRGLIKEIGSTKIIIDLHIKYHEVMGIKSSKARKVLALALELHKNLSSSMVTDMNLLLDLTLSIKNLTFRHNTNELSR